LPPDVESSRYGPRLSGLVGLLGSAFPLSISKSQALLQQLLWLTISRGTTTTICQRLGVALAHRRAEALLAARQQPMAYVDETGAPTSNAVDEVLRAAGEQQSNAPPRLAVCHGDACGDRIPAGPEPLGCSGDRNVGRWLRAA
jgi:hypothetical protein